MIAKLGVRHRFSMDFNVIMEISYIRYIEKLLLLFACYNMNSQSKKLLFESVNLQYDILMTEWVFKDKYRIN